MKKYKNLSKPELMEKQNTLSVHSGGRFVSLDLETEVQHAGSCKKKAEQILATVVMGMNLVNTVAPLAVLVAAEQKLGAAPQPARSEAEPFGLRRAAAAGRHGGPGHVRPGRSSDGL